MTLPFEEQYVNLACNLTVDEIKERIVLSIKVLLDSLLDNEIYQRELSMTLFWVRAMCHKLNIDYDMYIEEYLEAIK